MPRLRGKHKTRKILQSKDTLEENKSLDTSVENKNSTNEGATSVGLNNNESSSKLAPKTPVYKGALGESNNHEPTNDDSVYDFKSDENQDASNSTETIPETVPTIMQENLNETIINIIKNNNETDANCSICNQNFDNPLDLLRHKRDLHYFPRTIVAAEVIERYFDSPNRSFCPICKKPIKTRNYRSVFIKHLMVHTVGENFECKVCSKKFKRRDHLRAHEKRHIVMV